MVYKKILVWVTLSVFILVVGIYSLLLFVIPEIINSKSFTGLVEQFVFKKTGIGIFVQNQNFSINSNLRIELKIEKLILNCENKKAAEIDKFKLNADLKKFALDKIYAESVYIDIDSFKPLIGKKKHSYAHKNFNLNKFPDLLIKKLTIVYHGINMQSDRIVFIKNNSGETVIQLIEIPVNTLLSAVLYFQKSQDPKKKFLENFKEYGGKLSLDLRYKNNVLNGNIRAVDLRAVTVLFEVPLIFQNAEFTISDNVLRSEAAGIFGTEKIEHSLIITDILSSSREVNGSVKSTLSEGMVQKYLPQNIKIKKFVPIKVDYNITNKKVDVRYYLYLPPKADIFYGNAYLGLRKKERRFYARTYKDGDYLYLKNYNYSIINDSVVKNIILGTGLFISQNGHLTPQWITCTTNGFAPVSVTGSFGRYVQGGKFRGNFSTVILLKLIFRPSLWTQTLLPACCLIWKSKFRGLQMPYYMPKPLKTWRI